MDALEREVRGFEELAERVGVTYGPGRVNRLNGWFEDYSGAGWAERQLAKRDCEIRQPEGPEHAEGPWPTVPQELERRKERNMDKLLSVPEVADWLGVSKDFVWKRVWSREIPTVCLGRRRLVRPVDLQKFVDDRTERVA